MYPYDTYGIRIHADVHLMVRAHSARTLQNLLRRLRWLPQGQIGASASRVPNIGGGQSRGLLSVALTTRTQIGSLRLGASSGDQ